MLRNFIVGAFEAFAWVFFVGIIAYCTWYGWHAAELGVLRAGTVQVEPWAGAIGGFVAGFIAAVVVTGLIFTLLDMRASLDQLAWLAENGRGARNDERDVSPAPVYRSDDVRDDRDDD